MPKVTIQNWGKTVEIPTNANLREALMKEKAPLYPGMWRLFNCHGRGRCGSCEIMIIDGAEHLTERTPAELKKLKTYDTSRRLSCQCAIIGDEDVTINTLCY